MTAYHVDETTMRQVLADAPLGVFRAASQNYQIIPAAMEPLLIDSVVWQDLAKDVRLMMQALQKLVQHWRKHQEPVAQLVFGELQGIERDAAWRLDQSAVLAAMRFDLFFSGADIKVIEVNTTIPAMQAYSDMIAEAYIRSIPLKTPEMERLLRAYQESSNTQALLQSLLGCYRGVKSSPVIAIIARPHDSQLAELLWYQRRWQEAGYECLLATPLELSSESGVLKVRERPVDLIYRHIFASHLEPDSVFGKALNVASPTSIYNPIAAHFELKGLLAALSALTPSEHQSLHISEDEADAIHRRLPWTRLLRAGATTLMSQEVGDLVTWVQTNPHAVVVKSSVGYGGHRVILGSDFETESTQTKLQKIFGTAPQTWSSFVERLASGEQGVWIVQERLAGLKRQQNVMRDGVVKTEWCHLDCSIFADTGTKLQIGGASRFHADPIVNIGTGGGLVPFFWGAAILELFYKTPRRS